MFDWKSLSFWFNVAAVILAVLNGFGFADFEPAPWVPGLAVGIIALINLLKQFFPKVRVGGFGL